MAKLYLAGKLNSGEGSLSEFSLELEGRGHEVTLKWWVLPKLPTPYLDYPGSSSQAAEDMVQAVLS